MVAHSLRRQEKKLYSTLIHKKHRHTNTYTKTPLYYNNKNVTEILFYLLSTCIFFQFFALYKNLNKHFYTHLINVNQL